MTSQRRINLREQSMYILYVAAHIPVVHISSLKEIIIEENKVSTIQSGLPLIDPKAKRKEKLTEPAKMTKVQAEINASMIKVDESSKAKIKQFDDWVDFRTVDHLIVLVNEKRVKAIAQIEQRILE